MSDTPEPDMSMIIILGASYAKGWDIQSIGTNSVVNKGIDGNQSFEMLTRFQRDVVSLDPNTVIIWGFINDIFRSDAEDLEGTKDRIKQSYEEMLAAAEDHDIEVILATEVSIREPSGAINWLAGVAGRLMQKTSYQDMINKHVFEVNDWLRDFAESRQLRILDFESVLADPDGRRKAMYATDDGSHVTAEAYRVLSTYTRKVMLSDQTVESVK